MRIVFSWGIAYQQLETFKNGKRSENPIESENVIGEKCGCATFEKALGAPSSGLWVSECFHGKTGLRSMSGNYEKIVLPQCIPVINNN